MCLPKLLLSIPREDVAKACKAEDAFYDALYRHSYSWDDDSNYTLDMSRLFLLYEFVYKNQSSNLKAVELILEKTICLARPITFDTLFRLTLVP